MAHILVVEDSFFIRQSLQLMLREAAYGVTVTGDGALGLAKAREIVPDLVILDLMLPSTPGTTVLQELKLDPKTREIPVLVLSGLAKSNENALKRMGATSFCEKSLL
jgi:DNA-binding response OmpR family regulator